MIQRSIAKQVVKGNPQIRLPLCGVAHRGVIIILIVRNFKAELRVRTPDLS